MFRKILVKMISAVVDNMHEKLKKIEPARKIINNGV